MKLHTVNSCFAMILQSMILQSFFSVDLSISDCVVMVAARSDVFSAMFEHEMEERKHVSTRIIYLRYKRFRTE